ncbi:cellulose binding domain-containing protein [Flectobacillus roseus]|uniref:cellulose binding domain-containing protein n=1 Tax=Flectobacillus roseus TaxID=502259 RepID=UPI003628B597
MKKVSLLIFRWACLLLIFSFSSRVVNAQVGFTHPGLLHSNADFDRIKLKIANNQEPWISAYNIFKTDVASSKTYSLRGPADSVQRTQTSFRNETIFKRDANAAYNNAIMWKLTGDTAHAEKAIQIMNAWSYTLKALYGSEVQLTAGQQGFRWANAAEIIRSSYGGWAQTDIAQFENMLKTKIVPHIEMYGDANWGGGCIKAMMAIGVFCNDTALYNSALNAFDNHACTSLSKIIASSGQNTESGRDQVHAQINIGHLSEVAQVAYNQGIDLFASLDNRILTGFEYTAKYMLSNEVPYSSSIYRCTMGPWSTISATNRTLAELIPMYELVYNHYVNIKGLSAPYTTMAASTRRIETKSSTSYDGEHLMGWGTLMYSQDQSQKQSQTVTFPAIHKKYGDADFDPGATSSSGLSVYYMSSDPKIATIVNNKVHIVSAGVVVITAYQTGNSSYSPASASQTMNLIFNPYQKFEAENYSSQTGFTSIAANEDVNGEAMSVTGTSADIVYTGAVLGNTGPNIMYFRYSNSSDSSAKITVRMNAVNGPKLGAISLKPTGGEQKWQLDSCALSAPVATKDIWLNVEGKVNLNWMLMDSVKTFNTDPVSVSSVKIEAEDYSDKGGNVDWNSTGLGNIKPVGWVVMKNINLNGLTKIEVQASSNSSAGSSINKIIEVRLDALTGPIIATLTIPKTGNWNTYTLVSSNISGISGVHHLYFRFTVSGGSFTSFLYNIDWFKLYYNTQTVQFPALATKYVGDESFYPSATASSELAVNYVSQNPAIASIIDGKIQINKSGTAVIKAYQNGNASFSPATPVSQTLNILKKTQSIDFNSLPIKTLGDADFEASATVSSGLTISYVSSNHAVATIVDGKIHLVGAGTTTITASQAGNEVYNSATEVSQVLTVNKKSQNIIFNTLPTKTLGDTDFEGGATASSSLTVSYTSSNPAVATIIDGKIHLVGAGTTTITASQVGNEVYNSATEVSQVLKVLNPVKLSVKYQNADNGSNNNIIRPYLVLYNEGNVSVNYSDLTIRYWLTPENYTGINSWIDYAQLGNNNVKMKYVPLSSPRNGALGYMEYSFTTSAGTLSPSTNSGVIQSRFTNTDWANLNEIDDYSYSIPVNENTFNANDHITIYKNGQLVYGIEPTEVLSNKQVKVYLDSKSNATSNTISSYLKIDNTGNTPLNYQDLKVRYWFTKEGNSPLNFFLDYAKLGSSNVTSQLVPLTTTRAGADTYLELGISPNLGVFYPLSTTENIQYRIAKSDWSAFNQSDDFSYTTDSKMSLTNKISVYYQGQLIYGEEPATISANAARTTAESNPWGLEINLLGNPIVDDQCRFSLKGVNGKPLSITLFSSTGNMLTTQDIFDYQEEKVLTIPFDQYLQGVYLLKITSLNQSVVVKIIK